MKTIEELIIWENEDYLVLNKPAGIATQSSKSDRPSIWKLLESERKESFHLSNRLDQPVSGCLAFSKHNEDGFVKQIIHKVYAVIVEKNREIAPQGTLIHYLKRVPAKSKADCTDNQMDGFKKAVLHYTLMKELDNYYVLKVILRTGRFHQIRAQLSHIGLAVKGDVKYGARRKNRERNIHLHARELTLYPNTDNQQTIVAEFPEDVLWSEAARVI